jgi:hypothetical protein
MTLKTNVEVGGLLLNNNRTVAWFSVAAKKLCQGEGIHLRFPRY